MDASNPNSEGSKAVEEMRENTEAVVGIPTGQSEDTHNEKPSAVPETPQANGAAGLPSSDFKPEADLEKAHSTHHRAKSESKFGGEEDNPAIPVSYARSTSPTLGQRTRGESGGRTGEDVVNRMHKFSLYETSTRFYLVGADIMDTHYRVLKIDRTAPPGHLNIFEDDIIYSKREMNQLLNAIDDGNKANGGMKLKCSAWGLLGFVRFTEAYYMLLITKRAQVAMIGGHYVYQVDGTEMIPLTTGSTSRFQKDRNAEEARFLGILNNLDLTRSFYFSYSYNITRSLQQNIIRERNALNEGLLKAPYDFQDMFVWNHYLLDPARTAMKNVYDWCHPIIHGYIDQSSLDIYGRRVYITVIARRSRFFAGARFLKRGTNDLGYVANDVETEQIVSDALNTSFHAPGPRLHTSPNYTSYVQHRGSIPLYWTQDNTGVTPKPDIDLNLVDPFYSPAALHFDNLFERYGSPLYVLNLVKSRERIPRESKLLFEYQNGIDYLNQSLPQNDKIIYEAFDMSRASKTRGQDVIGTLEQIAEKVIRVTGFFHNGETDFDAPRVQNGVARTNCIDCLDRTNAAQFVIGKRALGRQLQALGIIAGKTVEYDTDCVEIFTRMFHDHGDQIAIQYGGSHLVNTMATYRKINHWQSSSRDMVESFKRYYHNSFLDSQRQEAYNLFLGNYIYIQGQPMLWELQTDYYLHHGDPSSWLTRPRRDYITWYRPQFLEKRVLPPVVQHKHTEEEVGKHDDYWIEYYRPLALSSFLKIFAYRLNDKSSLRRFEKSSAYPLDVSPFIVRKRYGDSNSPQKGLGKQRKGVTIVDPSSETDSRPSSVIARGPSQFHDSDSPTTHSILRDPHFETELALAPTQPKGTYPSLTTSTSSGLGFNAPKNFVPADKALIHQWTLTQFHENSLNPSVSLSEQDEYSRYVEHPLNLPLVVSTETSSLDDPSALAFHDYLSMADAASNPFPVPATSEWQHVPDFAPALLRPTSAAAFSTSLNTPFSHYPAAESTVTFASNVVLGSGGVKHFPAQTNPKFHVSEQDIEEFEEYLRVEDNPLDVLEEDGTKKRYKAYRQWLKGKSFFKQSKVDREWMSQLPVR
ncbi:polyphosphoinositide phosphatase-like protein Fig4 [Sporormia fimetaria CBS 119925]|uniref:Polyphosphoinositide phosphatase-like protein Fig4 n=1 Tax=Sporormia fimetaria CBS 119925 TaxID=1340428 RepID=A0A6A6VCZ7_9PLEO|nr:polyphosphoinositide phosphatase-like protein Fig4 [Sporormia fimetaria CBS 119925]